MTVTSLYKLAESDNGGVYKYLIKLLEEKNADITLSESLILYSGLTKFKNAKQKDFDHFIMLFSNNKKLTSILSRLKESGNYDFLLNEKTVDYDEIGEDNYFLIDEYIKIFGKDNNSFTNKEKLEASC